VSNELAVFQDRIRKVWHNNEWWFSIVDIIEVLTDSANPRLYWSTMKRRMQDEGFRELYAKCLQLKFQASDGKHYKTDAATIETMFRIIQSIPSPNAEPVKLWLAKAGTERLQEEAQPGLAEQRLTARYRKKGYPDEWIGQRLQGMIHRADAVGEWVDRGAGTGRQIAALTDRLSMNEWGLTTRDHKVHKSLPFNADLRDSMTGLELAITALGEATAAELHRDRDTQGFGNLGKDCDEAGDAAHRASLEIEKTTGKPVLSRTNYKELQQGRQRELQPRLFDQSED
jgi:DNA-damage-inducible protein D